MSALASPKADPTVILGVRGSRVGLRGRASIPLSRGRVALIDEADLELVSGYVWWVHRSHSLEYVRGHTRGQRRGERKKAVRLHRLLLDAQPGQLIDHINGDTFDNRRTNLRFTTYLENARCRRAPRRAPR